MKKILVAVLAFFIGPAVSWAGGGYVSPSPSGSGVDLTPSSIDVGGNVRANSICAGLSPCALIAPSVFTSSGMAIFQSTSPTATHSILTIRRETGNIIFKFQRNNRMAIGLADFVPQGHIHVYGNGEAATLYLDTDTGQSQAIIFRKDLTTNIGSLSYDNSGNNLLFNGGGNNSEKARINSSGELGINTGEAISARFTVTGGSINVNGTGAAYLISNLVAFSSVPVHFAGGALTANLTSGVTFYAFTTPSAITLRTITTTIQVAGIGAVGDTIRCNDPAGTGIEVTSAAAAAAGTITDSLTGAANIAANTRVSCHIESGNATKPNLSMTLGYVIR